MRVFDPLLSELLCLLGVTHMNTVLCCLATPLPGFSFCLSCSLLCYLPNGGFLRIAEFSPQVGRQHQDFSQIRAAVDFAVSRSSTEIFSRGCPVSIRIGSVIS